MKRFITSLIVLSMLPWSLTMRGEDIISKVRNSQARAEKVEKDFKEVRTFTDKSKATVTLQGKLSYSPETRLAMNYANGELFSIDGSTMIIDRDGKHQQFDLSKNVMMRSLSHAILYAFSGRMDELAAEQNANILTSEKDGHYIVAITAKAVAARGYSCVEATYDAKTGVLLSMRMDEFTGQRTYYSYTK